MYGIKNVIVDMLSGLVACGAKRPQIKKSIREFLTDKTQDFTAYITMD